MIIAPDGYILVVFGPYEAAANYASIMKSILKYHALMRTTFQAGDIFIVDRKFRDVLPFLKNKGFVVHSPAFCEPGQSLLDTSSVNESRIQLDL